jgi:predicted transcriptional regulator
MPKMATLRTHAEDSPAAFPPQLNQLPKREREIAMMIYAEGPATAKKLEKRMTRALSNSALRCMLGRLCKKGILSRRKLAGSHSETDRRVPFVYIPSLTADVVRKSAIKQLAEDYFEGSLLMVAREAIALLKDDVPLAKRGPSRRTQSTKLAA